jgi:L-histidine N-alpha-methyltransferase
VELGSGLSTKTRLLLDGFDGAGILKRFVPFDVDEATLRHAAQRVDEEYGGVAVHAVVGDFERHLDYLPREGTRLVAFLGSTIGNLNPAQRAGMLGTIAGGLDRTDWFLLGTDLVKDESRLVAAYDDSAGVTAEFNRNVLHVVNRELGGTFVPERFDHVARWDSANEWIEMLLRSRGAQDVRVDEVDLDVHFADGEEMRTEISAKFRRDALEAELRDAGLELVHWWTDDAGDYALSMSRRR